MENIPDHWGTAVNVQAMVFGNMGDTSGTGVAFTRDAATGENLFNGEYLIDAQGEDVVAGTRTPNPLNKDTKNTQNQHLVNRGNILQPLRTVSRDRCDPVSDVKINRVQT